VLKRLKQLKEILSLASYQYYILDDPKLTDSEYDKLFQELLNIEKTNPSLITDDSPSQKVGAKPSDKFRQKKHLYPMLSLSNVFSKQELSEFDKRIKRYLNEKGKIEYYAEAKFDGLALSIVYQNSTFSYATTRGDGTTGEDVTENVRTIANLPLRLRGKDHPKILEIRGEVIMPKNDFLKLNKINKKNNEKIFATARNAAAGSLRQLDPKKTAQRPLRFYTYASGNENIAKTHSATLLKLKKWALPTSDGILFDEIQQLYEYQKQLFTKREKLPYEIDGAVFKVNSLELQQKLGNIARSVRWAVAYKFPTTESISKVVSVEFQVGRTGTLTPVAHLKEVLIDGVKVQRATLHNMDEIIRKDIRIGDIVLVHRAGDVIPEVIKPIVEKRDKDVKKIKIPKECPVCSSKVTKTDNQAAYRCSGSMSCKAQLIANIQHYVSKQALDIEGFGKVMVETLVEKGIINNIADIYKLKIQDLITLDKMAQKSSNNLVEAIQKSKQTTLSRFIYALGIREIGESSSSILANKFKTLDNLKNASFNQILAIKDIGEIGAQNIIDFFGNKNNIAIIATIIKSGVKFTDIKTQIKQNLSGKTFVITGTLSMPRTKIKEQIIKNGGKVSSSLSSKTTALIAGKQAGSKLIKAQQLNIKIINEDGLDKMIKAS
jgi:DNA ligase (NAD+)